MTEQQAKRYLETGLPARFRPKENSLWLCPRCGTHLFFSDSAYPALSRRVHVDICPPCGTAEAVEDYRGRRTPLRGWYAVQLGAEAKEADAL